MSKGKLPEKETLSGTKLKRELVFIYMRLQLAHIYKYILYTVMLPWIDFPHYDDRCSDVDHIHYAHLHRILGCRLHLPQDSTSSLQKSERSEVSDVINLWHAVKSCVAECNKGADWHVSVSSFILFSLWKLKLLTLNQRITVYVHRQRLDSKESSLHILQTALTWMESLS